MSGMLHTYQGAWFPLVPAEITTDQVPLDAETSGSTLWDLTSQTYANKFAGIELGSEANGIDCYFVIYGADTTTESMHIYGQAQNGPAEKIAEASLAAGAAYFQGTTPEGTDLADTTTRLIVDTINLDATDEFHIRDVDTFDYDGNDRMAKLTFDTTGLKYLWFCFTAASGKSGTSGYGRVY